MVSWLSRHRLALLKLARQSFDLPWLAVFCLNSGNFSMISMEGYRGRQIFCLFLTWLSYASTYLLRKPLGVVSLRWSTWFCFVLKEYSICEKIEKKNLQGTLHSWRPNYSVWYQDKIGEIGACILINWQLNMHADECISCPYDFSDVVNFLSFWSTRVYFPAPFSSSTPKYENSQID